MSRKVESIKNERDGRKHGHNLHQNIHKSIQIRDIK